MLSVPMIVRTHEIGDKAYFFLQCVEKEITTFRIQIYRTGQDGHLFYERGQTYTDLEEAKEEYDQVIREAELTMIQGLDLDEMWPQVHYGQ
ncbi:TPA: hypothetical protein NKA85_003866 [Vibrio parahaemolyticus]|nr:hypothetical protein [Vibrio parahaemolyticus]